MANQYFRNSVKLQCFNNFSCSKIQLLFKVKHDVVKIYIIQETSSHEFKTRSKYFLTMKIFNE